MNGQAALNGFVGILQQLFKGFPLRRTTGDSGHFSPITTLLRFMDGNL